MVIDMSARSPSCNANPNGVPFLNLTATYYGVARWLFLRDTGRKLLHLDRQLATDDAVFDDLRSYLK